MDRHVIMLAALTLLSAGGLIQHCVYWSMLPERVATHFDGSGQANAWMDRTSAAVLLAAIQVGLPWFLVAIGHLARILPTSLINLPHREFWLADERRAATLAYMRYFLTVVAILTSLFMMAINHLVFLANLRDDALNVDACLTVLVLFLLAIGLLLIAMFRRFRMPRLSSGTKR